MRARFDRAHDRGECELHAVQEVEAVVIADRDRIDGVACGEGNAFELDVDADAVEEWQHRFAIGRATTTAGGRERECDGTTGGDKANRIGGAKNEHARTFEAVAADVVGE